MFQIRVILLKTDLLPYDDVADLFIIDPDGFIIRFSLMMLVVLTLEREVDTNVFQEMEF